MAPGSTWEPIDVDQSDADVDEPEDVAPPQLPKPFYVKNVKCLLRGRFIYLGPFDGGISLDDIHGLILQSEMEYLAIGSSVNDDGTSVVEFAAELSARVACRAFEKAELFYNGTRETSEHREEITQEIVDLLGSDDEGAAAMQVEPAETHDASPPVQLIPSMSPLSSPPKYPTRAELEGTRTRDNDGEDQLIDEVMSSAALNTIVDISMANVAVTTAVNVPWVVPPALSIPAVAPTVAAVPLANWYGDDVDSSSDSDAESNDEAVPVTVRAPQPAFDKDSTLYFFQHLDMRSEEAKALMRQSSGIFPTQPPKKRPLPPQSINSDEDGDWHKQPKIDFEKAKRPSSSSQKAENSKQQPRASSGKGKAKNLNPLPKKTARKSDPSEVLVASGSKQKAKNTFTELPSNNTLDPSKVASGSKSKKNTDPKSTASSKKPRRQSEASPIAINLVSEDDTSGFVCKGKNKAVVVAPVSVNLPLVPYGRARRILTPSDLPIATVTLRADVQFVDPNSKHWISGHTLPAEGRESEQYHVEDACLVDNTVVIGCNKGPNSIILVKPIQYRINHRPSKIEVDFGLHEGGKITCLASSPAISKLFLCGGTKKSVELCRLAKKSTVKQKEVFSFEYVPQALAYTSIDDGLCAAGKKIARFLIEYPKKENKWSKVSNVVRQILFDPESPEITALQVDHLELQNELYDARVRGFDGEPQLRFGVRTRADKTMTSYNRGSYKDHFFAHGFEDGQVLLWDTRNTRKPLRSTHNGTHSVVHVAFGAAGDILAYGNNVSEKSGKMTEKNGIVTFWSPYL